MLGLARSAVAWLDRFGLWPVIVGAGVVVAAYISGIAGLYWKFPLFDQVAVLIGVALILVWAVAQIVKRLVRPSVQELQTEVFNLNSRGLVLLRAGDLGGQAWDDWVAEMTAFFTQYGTAAERTYLAEILRTATTPDDFIIPALGALRKIGERLEKR